MGCCDDVRRVAQFYIDGTLGSDRNEYVKSHLSECHDCGDRVIFHQRIRAFLQRRLCAKAPDSLRNRILRICRSPQTEATS